MLVIQSVFLRFNALTRLKSLSLVLFWFCSILPCLLAFEASRRRHLRVRPGRRAAGVRGPESGRSHPRLSFRISYLRNLNLSHSVWRGGTSPSPKQQLYISL